MKAEELGERVIAALVHENTGNRYQRINSIREIAFEAIYRASEKQDPLCQFKNKNGWCKLTEGHKEKHTVIWLGDDDERLS